MRPYIDGMTPAQCRAARALIGMTTPELSQRAGIPMDRLAAFESEHGDLTALEIATLQSTLRAARVRFISGEAGSEGVRLSPDSDGAFIELEDLNASNDE